MRTPEGRVYEAMKRRCKNPKDSRYSGYGGRGIKICPQWDTTQGLEVFLRDMGPRPSPKHSLDRIDTNGDYTPENCRWATQKEQQRNRRNNLMLTLNGKTQSAADWGEETGIGGRTISDRIRRGWSVRRALSRAKGHAKGPRSNPQ